jgi:hypothetical protein
MGQQLPDGPGKELAETYCNSCHSLTSRVGSGYTSEGWSTVLRMMTNQGAPLPPELGYSRRREHCPQYLCNARWQLPAGQQPGEQHNLGNNREVNPVSDLAWRPGARIRRSVHDRVS